MTEKNLKERVDDLKVAKQENNKEEPIHEDIQNLIDSYRDKEFYNVGISYAGFSCNSVVDKSDVETWKNEFAKGIVPEVFECKHIADPNNSFVHYTIPKDPVSGDKIFFCNGQSENLFASYDEKQNCWEVYGEHGNSHTSPVTSNEIPFINGVATKNSKDLEFDIANKDAQTNDIAL
jgi:hypothetical protein